MYQKLNYLKTMNLIKLGTLLLGAMMLFSCRKTEGKGGKLSVSGTVVARYYDDNYKTYTGTELAADEDVYIIYGDQVGYGDKTKTDYQGRFEFKYLRSGNYKVYVYSKDTTQSTPSGEFAVVKDVSLSGDVDLGQITIAKKDERKLNDGPYTIGGTVYVKSCNSNYNVCTEAFGTPDVDVYVSKLGQVAYIDKVVTGDQGLYEFTDLPSGSYVVYVFSENPQSASDASISKYMTLKDTVVVNGANVSGVDFQTVE